ncbi:hypothetical protein ABW19_dt0210230 [Dactylella cylindrospora]|nr:hypothetical protein ABW19_dt0210230 [Dactylella cylindrospora]
MSTDPDSRELRSNPSDNSKTRARRPALIPAAVFNSLSSPEDLPSILPQLHGLNNGECVYLLPPPPPPPELALRLKLEKQQQRSLQRDVGDIDADGDWSMSGAVTPVGANTGMKRWSMKDLVDDNSRIEEEGGFETPKQFIHKRQTSGVSEDLFSWVNSSTDLETGTRTIQIDHQVIQDLDSLPTSPLSGTSHIDVQRQMERLREASRVLHEL